MFKLKGLLIVILIKLQQIKLKVIKIIHKKYIEMLWLNNNIRI